VLAGLLAQSWPTDGGDPISPEEAGRRYAAEHADPERASTTAATSPGRWLAKVGDMVDQLEHWGYTPELSTSHGGRTVSIALHNCPFLALARVRPDVVCGVHHGLITGALGHVGEHAVHIDVMPFVGPTRCLVKVTTETPFTPSTLEGEIR
jgi:predicted ArsR family transcriptional regulator